MAGALSQDNTSETSAQLQLCVPTRSTYRLWNLIGAGAAKQPHPICCIICHRLGCCPPDEQRAELLEHKAHSPHFLSLLSFSLVQSWSMILIMIEASRASRNMMNSAATLHCRAMGECMGHR